MPHTKKSNILITIFGATGDLTARKLLPALANLYSEDYLPENSKVIALGRRDFDDISYLDFVKSKNKKPGNLQLLTDFLVYKKIDILDHDQYKELSRFLDELGDENSVRLFYLAVAPDLFIPIASNLATSQIVQNGANHHLLAFEKPFGTDLKSAKEINKVFQTFRQRVVNEFKGIFSRI